MTEFIPTLIAGIMVFILAALVVSVPQQNTISGAVLAKTNGNQNYLIIAENTILRTIENRVLNETFTVNITNTHLSAFRLDTSYNRALIRIDNMGTSNSGVIVVEVNDNVVYRGQLNDKLELELGEDVIADENAIKVRVEKPSWEFWGLPEYKVVMKAYGLKKWTADKTFTLNKQRDATLKMFFLSETEGKLNITLNGKQLFYGKTGEYMELEIPASEFATENVMELTPSNDGYFSLDYAQLSFK